MDATTEITFDQFYVFKGPAAFPGETHHAWVEMFLVAGQMHVTAPSPCTEVADALEAVKRANPGCMVDELLADEVEDAMRFAR